MSFITHFTAKTTLKYVTCLLLVLTADFLFYDQNIGWTAGLFAMLLLSGMCLHRHRAHMGRPSQVALAAAAGLALAMIEDVNALAILLFVITVAAFAVVPWLHGWRDARTMGKAIWNLLISSGLRSLYLLSVASLFLFPAENTRLGLKRVRALFGVRMGGWPQMLYDSILIIHSHKPARQKHSYHLAFVRYWLLPLGFSALFIALFSQANPVIANWLGQIDWQINWRWFSFPSFGRLLFWFATAFGSWMLIRPRLRWQTKQPAVPKVRHTLASLLFNTRSIITSLIVFNALFMVQNLVDVNLLLNPEQGINYAKYAKDGAYPLIATVLLAAFFVLVALRPGSDAQHNKRIHMFVYGWIGQNVFLLFTAMYRLLSYIEVYSLTYMRVATLIWMALVAFGLILIVLRIYHHKSSRWLVNANAITAYAVLYLCCFVNFNSMIADYNVRHCYEVTGRGAALDVRYLRRLGVDAIPAMAWFERYYPHHQVTQRVRQERQSLQSWLRANIQNWRRWSFRNYRLWQDHEV